MSRVIDTSKENKSKTKNNFTAVEIFWSFYSISYYNKMWDSLNAEIMIQIQ